MPSRPKTDCLEPGCTEGVTKGRCPTHREEHRALTSPRVDYGPEWPRISKRWLRYHPTCARCGEPATETDHITPFRHFTTRRAAHNERNLQSLCSPCHKRKTATEDSTFASRARSRTPTNRVRTPAHNAEPPAPTQGEP